MNQHNVEPMMPCDAVAARPMSPSHVGRVRVRDTSGRPAARHVGAGLVMPRGWVQSSLGGRSSSPSNGISGVCVGSGYWQKPDLTKERFVPAPGGLGTIHRTLREPTNCRIPRIVPWWTSSASMGKTEPDH